MAELISLAHRPLAGENMRLVRNLSSKTLPERLRSCLCDMGLIDNVVLTRQEGRQWATIQFYSRLEAEACQRECDGRMIDGSRIRVTGLAPSKAATEPSESAKPLPLSVDKAREVMNHFLGFSGWSHSITSTKRVGEHAPPHLHANAITTSDRALHVCVCAQT